MSDIIDWLLALGGRRRKNKQAVPVIPARLDEPEPEKLRPVRTEPATLLVKPQVKKVKKNPVTWRRGHKTTLRERRERFAESCQMAHEQNTRKRL